MNYILFRASALTLFVACIAGADDPDFAVTFDDLAEFASAFHRRSDFHFIFSYLLSSLLKVSTFSSFRSSFFRVCQIFRHEKRCVTILPFRGAVGR
jgi:hypothetical protein